MRRVIEHYFRIPEKKSSIRLEILGGATTFLTMAYIIVVNPAILSYAGIPVGPSTVATILACVFGCILMGLYANRPIAVAPYMGENAFIAFGLAAITINGIPITWQQRLGTVFISGVAFLILTLLGMRRWLADAISSSMKHSFAVGIGLFLFLVGVNETKIIRNGVQGMPLAALPTRTIEGNKVVADPTVPPVKIGDWGDVKVQLAILGFVVITALLYWRVRGGIIIGMVLVAVIGYLLQVSAPPTGIFAVPWSEQYDVRQIAFHLDILGVLRLSMLHILLTLFLISFLDTLGSLVAVGSAGNMLDADGNFPEMEKPMLVDSLACMFSALVGTSTSGAYIESTTGVQEGARTGLAAVVTGLLFAATLFFIPLLEPVQQLKYAYAPALMAVGVLMTAAIRKIDFEDLSETVPALTTITMMLFTFNIANGLTAGLVLYPIFKLITGRWREINLGTLILGALCSTYFIFGERH